MDVIKSVAGDLNRVYMYYNLEEEEIDNVLYYSYDHHKKHDLVRLIETKCGLTSRLVRYLLGMKYSGKYKCYSDRFGKLTSACVIEIAATKLDLPSHVITFLNDKIYHSYAMKYTLKVETMVRKELEKRLRDFLKAPNRKSWLAITGVDDFEAGHYQIRVYDHTIDDHEGPLVNARTLVTNSLKALGGSFDERHLYDDFLLVLPDDPKKFILELKDKL